MRNRLQAGARRSQGFNPVWRSPLRWGVGAAIVLIVPASAAPAQAPARPGLQLTVRQGTIPIILSAPHGGRSRIPDVPERQGVAVKKFVKTRDQNTAELAERLADAMHRRLPGNVYLVVARFDRKYLDVNRPAEAAYESPDARPSYEAYHCALREACREVQRKWGRGLLLDLHGQAARADAVFVGTTDGKSVSALRERFGAEALRGPQGFLGQLEQSGWVLVPASGSDAREDRRFNGGYIVQTYGSHRGTGIDAVQLELGSQFRSQSQLAGTADDLAEAIATFAKQYLPAKPKRE